MAEDTLTAEERERGRNRKGVTGLWFSEYDVTAIIAARADQAHADAEEAGESK